VPWASLATLSPYLVFHTSHTLPTIFGLGLSVAVPGSRTEKHDFLRDAKDVLLLQPVELGDEVFWAMHMLSSLRQPG